MRVERPQVEPAYADAHRLLSELNLVARHLSLGLDPHTLATALVEELQGLAVGARATVLATRIQANNKRLGEIGKRACELDRALTQLLSDVDALLGDNQAVVSEMHTLSVSKELTHETPILPHNRPVFLGQVREKVRAHRLIIGDKYPSILLSL